MIILREKTATVKPLRILSLHLRACDCRGCKLRNDRDFWNVILDGYSTELQEPNSHIYLRGNGDNA